MADETQKWGSPTKYPIASHETDKLPIYNSNGGVTQQSITTGILSEAVEVMIKCANGDLSASTAAARFLKKHGYR